MRHHFLSVWLFVLVLSCGAASLALPQAQELAVRGPRFIAAWTPSAEAVDASNVAVLRRRISLDLAEVTADEALKEITRQADLEISYSNTLLPTSRSVSLHARRITVAAALTEVLLDAGVDVAVARGGQLALVKRRTSRATVSLADSGVVSGRVTDKATGAPIVGAAVVIEGTQHATTTGSDGGYRIANVLAGTYEVRARYIGYASLMLSITVTATDVSADFALVKSVQVLDEVVTTGTVLPTEVKALPSPISVITGSDIEQQKARTITDLLRQTVPSAVAWQYGADPQATPISVRGGSSLDFGNGVMKVYLDGIEVTNRTFAAIDPASIERVEIIRGPQAAAIYGSDAISGVMQVFSKRGDPTVTRPQISGEIAGGLVESPYEQSGALRQQYAASLRGGARTGSYQLGGGYEKIGNWVPEGGTSTSSIYGGLNFTHGRLVLEVSGRHYAQGTGNVIDPRIARTGFAPFLRPNHQSVTHQEQTYGARLRYTANSWWSHGFTVGIDRLTTDLHSTAPALAFPSDTFLAVLSRGQSKTTMAYHTSVQVRLASMIGGSVTGGVDRYVLRGDGFFTFGALNTTGTIRFDPTQTPTLTRSSVTNTGYFAQFQLNVAEQLFLTTGLRADDNSALGADVKTPLSPRVGASYVLQFGATTLKLRAAYGEAIQPPTPGQRDAQVFANSLVRANLRLSPARQRGWDGGLDLVFSRHGSLSVTYYDQTARDLIQNVLVDAASSPIVYQNQNVGRIKNRGIELEGVAQLGIGELRAQYAIASSRIQDLGPNYTGDLLPGDRLLLVPRQTAGAALTIAPTGNTSVTAGMAAVGRWTFYDFFAQFSCFAGTAACRPTLRDYHRTYPGFVKVRLSVAQQLTPAVSGFVSADNLTNNTKSEFYDLLAVMGRVVTVGARVRY